MNKNIKQLIFICALLLVMTCLLIATKNYFNRQEINTLVDGAEARGLDYELTITNKLTNDYIFEVKK
ncbi:hypothetical protein ACMGE7_07640 [Macrococcus equi]|uniref:hypothetical protein n=1 Tax=Macrococcus equi TaxID=3395462 RepID=UPI0039BEC9DD